MDENNIIYFKPILINKCVRWVITDKSVVRDLEINKNGKFLWEDDLLKVEIISRVCKGKRINIKKEKVEKSKNI